MVRKLSFALQMVSDASKKKAAQKKAAAAAKRGGKAAASKAAAPENGSSNVDSLSSGVGNLVISDRTCTGVLCSHPLSRDIRVSTRSPIFYSLRFFL